MARIKRKVKKWKMAVRKYGMIYEVDITLPNLSQPMNVEITKKKIRKLARRKSTYCNP